MSSVTDYVLFVWGDEPGVVRLNELLQERHDQQFKRFDHESTGGGKYMDHDVWAMGANYVDISSMLELMGQVDWEDRASLVLIMQHSRTYTDEKPSIYVANGTDFIALF